jgi:hypothetical protein
MNLSIKAAKQLGERLARSLHEAGNDSVKRGAILDAKSDVLGIIPKWETQTAVDDAFKATLDVLEPLLSGRRW